MWKREGILFSYDGYWSNNCINDWSKG